MVVNYKNARTSYVKAELNWEPALSEWEFMALAWVD